MSVLVWDLFHPWGRVKQLLLEDEWYGIGALLAAGIVSGVVMLPLYNLLMAITARLPENYKFHGRMVWFVPFVIAEAALFVVLFSKVELNRPIVYNMINDFNVTEVGEDMILCLHWAGNPHGFFAMDVFPLNTVLVEPLVWWETWMLRLVNAAWQPFHHLGKAFTQAILKYYAPPPAATTCGVRFADDPSISVWGLVE
jgi:hypothetical protein